MRYSLRALWFALVLIGTVPTASAQNQEQAQLFNRSVQDGEQQYREGKYEAAIARFQTAYSLKPDPFLLYNLGLAHYKLGKDAEALNYFEFYLRTAPQIDEGRRQKIDGYVKELRERITKKEEERQKVVYVTEKRGPRPKWRIGTGAALIAGSVVMLGFGGRLLYLDGRCTELPSAPVMECDAVFRTTGMGAGLTVTGALLGAAGALLIAWPGAKVPVRAAPEELMRSERGRGGDGSGAVFALTVAAF